MATLKIFTKSLVILSAAFIVLTAFTFLQQRHVLYVIGDSTVKNSSGHGGPGLWGWGTFIGDFFDSTKLRTENQAMAGRSSRTFYTEGRWENVRSTLQPGDFVIMQFGHNDGSVPDTAKAGNRGTLKGTGEETKELVFQDGRKEIVHTYGWYIRKFVTDAKSRGAIPIVCSMIPRNMWKDGNTLRASNDFGKWAAEIAKEEGAYFIDLNSITGDKYDAMGADKVKEFFPGDHTHTNEEGARMNAASVVEGLRKIKDCPLNGYLK